MPEYRTLVFSTEFVETYGSRDFSFAERRQFQRALLLLDTNERHPSLRVHALSGDQQGWWSASASDVLRVVFRRLPDGRKRLGACSRHYDR